MAWSTTAPALPSGSSWGGTQSTAAFTANHFKISAQLSIARLNGTGVAVKVVFTLENGSYGDYDNTKYFYLKTDSEAADTSIGFPSGTGTKTVYWQGTADAGATVSVTVGVNNTSASQQTKALTAPALLALPLWLNDGGTLKQVEKAYYNDSGTIKECDVYYNDNGTIKEIK